MFVRTHSCEQNLRLAKKQKPNKVHIKHFTLCSEAVSYQPTKNSMGVVNFLSYFPFSFHIVQAQQIAYLFELKVNKNGGQSYKACWENLWGRAQKQ